MYNSVSAWVEVSDIWYLCWSSAFAIIIIIIAIIIIIIITIM